MKSRKTIEFSESFKKRWLGYAAAAGAAGVGLLSSAQPAKADIIYTSAHTTVEPNSSLSLDLNHDGTADFTLANHQLGPWPSHPSVEWASMVLQLPPRNSVLVLSGACCNPSFGVARLAAGAAVGPGGHFANSEAAFYGALTMGLRTSYGFVVGPWYNGGAGYLGFRFQIDGQAHYGWASLSTKYSYYTGFAETLTGYAYDTVANQALTAGQGQTPEPGTLGLLALGSLGLGFWRRRKAVASRQSAVGDAQST